MPIELLTLNTVVFIFWALIRERYHWSQALVSFVYLGLGIWNLFYLLKALGYIIKVS